MRKYIIFSTVLLVGVLVGVVLTIALSTYIQKSGKSKSISEQDNIVIYFDFDKSIYYPDLNVFENFDLPVLIELKFFVNKNINCNVIKVQISSSIDSKEINLTRDAFGVFSGKIFAVGKGLPNNRPLGKNYLNVRYGDKITAKFGLLTATTLFLFPHYILKIADPKDWESGWCKFDSQGVPMVEYLGITDDAGVLLYNPVTISQYALANYCAYLDTGNITYKEKFLIQIKWLIENAKQKGNFSVWEYNFDYQPYGCTNPFVSAMAQGQGLSALLRAYVLTGNISYINVAEKIMRSFQVEMKAGGVRYTDSNGTWFEEMADVGASSSKILNGFITALMGLYEYSFETNNSNGWKCFWEGVETLSNNIHRYDTGSWSYYDLLRHRASLGYHEAHIYLLKILYELTGDKVFLCYSDKFQYYLDFYYWKESIWG